MMELTLTGASLTGDKKKSVAFASPVVEKSSSLDKLNLLKSHQMNGHSHEHSHSHQDECCSNAITPRSRFTAVESIPVDKLIQNKPMLFASLMASVKGGSFSSFQYLVDIILQHEKENGDDIFQEWGTDMNGCKSCLGRRLQDGHTITHWCAKRSDDIRFLEYLAQKVSDIDMHIPSADNVGMAPLHWACTEGSIPICNFLLKQVKQYKGLDMMDPMLIRDKAGCTPLLIASQYGHADLVAFLIKRGADPSAVDSSLDTALHWAAYKGSVPVCGLLLYLNGIVNHLDLKDSFGQTPLHLAALRGNIEVIEYIMEQAEAYVEQMDASDTQEDENEENLIDAFPQHHLPRKLLQMEDKDGKNPLDLAVKKQKVHCELLLRQYMDKHCNPNHELVTKTISALKQFFSCRSWLSWIGFIPESSGRPPRFIFWFVVANLALATLYELIVYVPLFGSMNSKRLQDHTMLHLLTIFGFVVSWMSLILVHNIDPGLLAMKYSATAGADKNSFSCFHDNKRVKREMHTLTNELRKSYEDTLESFAERSDTGIQSTENLGLCHSCHVVRVLRSKHCRYSNKCTLLFDHHCPFVGQTIGLYNYKYFYMFILSITTTEILFAITGFQYIQNGPGKEYGKILIAIYFSLYMIMTGTLSIYHTQLIRANLTTNEHQNLHKPSYKYLNGGDGQNPFNKGFFRNMYLRMFPSRDTYSFERSSRSDSEEANVSVGMSNKKYDEEKSDLITHIV